MVNINICGIDVEFPFEPYGCQKKYMEKVITCLQKGQNGVLESPTGTGKTLCLLCAALAWRETYVARLQLERVGKLQENEFNEELGSTLNAASGGLNPGESWERGFIDAPKIIYASRTHSQISQAVGELKNTRYNPKICVLGSREQMCINSEVMKEETNNGKVHLCRIKVSGKQCFYYNNLEANKASVPSGILDIEDLVSVGTEKKFCPYYMAREMRKEADLIFMPYNYVLDFKARSAHSIDLTNTIIILDEAHNVESVCENNASFDLTSFDLASCIEDCQQSTEIILQREEDGITFEEGSAGDLTTEDTSLMKTLFLQLETCISEISLDKNESVTKSASFLYDELNKLNVNAQSKDQILDTLEKMSGLLAGSKTKSFKAKSYALDKFSSILKTMFSRTSSDSTTENFLQSISSTSKFYKVHIHTEKKKDDRKNQKKLDAWASNSSSSKEAPRTLSYWCFNPGLSMQELVLQGVRSLILTSGTLSPLPSFKQELAVNFDVELENSHVIERQQVFVGIIPQGPDGKKLNSSYQFRSTAEYQISLGNTIVNLVRIIPHGLLVFFPSYPVMDMVLAKWQECGIWNRISTVKGLFIEPRRKDGLNEAMEQFYEKIHDPNMKGAVFFAVCRGKVSEGLDFANENGRAVVITGLPFPPSFDPRVVLKKQYLDEQKNKYSISGKDWYRQQASRAVNQAIGRVIRHKDDFGAILLCDERFCYGDAKTHLPAWIKQQIKEYKDFGQAQRDLVIFFREIQQKMGPVVQKQKRKYESMTDSVDSYTHLKSKLIKTSNQVNSSGVRERSQLKQSISNILKPSESISGPSNTSATNSLAVLKKTSDKKNSVFDQINENSNNNTKDCKFPTTAVNFNERNINSTATSVAVKTKKYKIIKSSIASSNVTPGPSKGISSAPSTTARDSKVKDAQIYLTKVKATLSKERYEKFGKAMKLFKQTGNIKILMAEFQNVFDKADLEHISLMEGFSFFVKASDKKYFELACDKFAGTPCIICLQEALKPHQSPCNHIACYPCWISFYKAGIIECPKCRTTFQKKNLVKSFMDGQLGLYGYDFTNLV